MHPIKHLCAMAFCLGFPLLAESQDDMLVETLAGSWEVTDVGSGIQPSFDFGLDDRIHVMGVGFTEAGNEVWHAVADGPSGPWRHQSIASGLFFGGQLEVDPGGKAHLVWHDHILEDPVHFTVDLEGKVTSHSMASENSHNGWDNSLAFDGRGHLHHASVNPEIFGAQKGLEYDFFDGDTWSHDIIEESGPMAFGLGTSIAIDNENSPHIAFCEATDWLTPGDLRYARRDSMGWIVTTVVGGGARGRFPSLALDPMGRPRLAWLDIDETTNTLGFVRFAFLGGEDNDEWVIETVDTLEHLDIGSAGARKCVSLKLDDGRRPHWRTATGVS